MKNVEILRKVPPVNSEVLVQLKNFESSGVDMDWRWPSWIFNQQKQCSMLDFLKKQKSNTMVRTTSVAFLSSLALMVPAVNEN